jgi:putative oxidoreductase
MSIGLFLLRLVVGLTFAAHGGQKLFGWFSGGGISGTASAMEQMGFRPGRLNALLAGLAEFGAGLALVLGLLTPLAAGVAVAVMLVAAVGVHLRNGFFLQNGGIEYTLVLAVSALSLAFTGPGTLSLDYALGISWSGAPWGLFALVLGAVGGGLHILASRRSTPQPARQA